MGEMNGKDYRARVRLSNQADDTLAEAGETCERVPASSLDGLLNSALIEPMPAAKTVLPVVPETFI